MSWLDDHPGSDSEQRDARNRMRIADPQPGDYWHEMFSPYFVVIEREGDKVLICDKRKTMGDGWTFDLTACRYMTIAELRHEVTYGTMPDKFVADCSLKSHMWAVDLYREMKRDWTFVDLYS